MVNPPDMPLAIRVFGAVVGVTVLSVVAAVVVGIGAKVVMATWGWLF